MASSPTRDASPKEKKSPGPAQSPAPAGPALEPEDAEGDEPEPILDSASMIGGSDTTSLASSIFKYRVENGRTYHAYKAGAYVLPNDEAENERLDLQHNLLVLMQDNKLYLSPIGKDKTIGRVLDAGTGTGIWAIDFADEHPDASVVGVDLSPIQPSFVPPNVEFFIDDLEEPWTFSQPFDFIYMRMLTGSIRDWPKLVGQAFEHLKPGAYLELLDPINPLQCDDGTLPKDCALMEWNNLFVEASVKLGAPMDSARGYKQHLQDAGFVDVTQVEFRWPMNSWPRDEKYKNVGAWCYANITQGLQALSLMLFTNVLGWSAEQVERMLVDVRKDLKNRAYHGYWPVYTVYGRKPE